MKLKDLCLVAFVLLTASGIADSTAYCRPRVNDESANHLSCELKSHIVRLITIPEIKGQRELTMKEDSTLTIKLADLVVSDKDNPEYPIGFSLQVLCDTENVYEAIGNIVRPARDFNGPFEVRITVNDGRNTSNIFRLEIFVTPVNDPPSVTLYNSGPLSYEPGDESDELFRRLVLRDVDSDYLGMAEVGFRQPNFSSKNDEIWYEFDTTKIRAIQDPRGILFLIGFASVDEYQVALRSIKYYYSITEDFNGQPEAILQEPRTVYVNVNDGERVSSDSERKIHIKARISLDIPNAFTPNGDNANDTWHLEPSNYGELDETLIRVYNKRGLLLYESNGFDQEWDGIFNGDLLPVGTYYYSIVVKLPYTRQTYKGIVVILY